MIKWLIAILVIAAFLYGGWELWLYWDQVSHDRDLQKQAAAQQVTTDSLVGMPNGLEASYQAAKKAGPAAVKNWLKRYGLAVQDPRRAGIELDYLVSIAHEDPVEAKKIYAEVKSRVHEDSPLFQRVKQLEKTYE